jgi:hypothetical protein
LRDVNVWGAETNGTIHAPDFSFVKNEKMKMVNGYKSKDQRKINGK